MEHYTELQNVLRSIFITERTYFEASQKVQIPELLRFLNHQKIVRNGYINKVVQVFNQNNIELSIFEIEKRKHTSDVDDLYAGLHTNSKAYQKIIEDCLAQDEKLIQQCVYCLNNTNIPIEISEVFTKMCTSLILYSLNGKTIIKEFTTKNQQKLFKDRVGKGMY